MDSAGQAALVSGKRSEGVHVWRFFLEQGLIKTAFSFGIDVAFGADWVERRIKVFVKFP